MIQHLLPPKARYIASQNVFYAPFTGQYDFNIAANKNQVVIKTVPGVMYFIDNYAFAGNITQEDFLTAVLVTPTMKLTRLNDQDNIFNQTIPLNQYAADKPATVFIGSNKGNDSLLLTFNGVLSQTAALVGVDPVIFTLSLAIYAIDDNQYNKEFMDRLNPSFAQRINS